MLKFLQGYIKFMQADTEFRFVIFPQADNDFRFIFALSDSEIYKVKDIEFYTS